MASQIALRDLVHRSGIADLTEGAILHTPSASNGENRTPCDQHFETKFLTFVALLQKLEIPTVNPSVLKGGDATLSTTGILGRGGQSKVDKINNLHSYDSWYSRRVVTEVVYKRVLTSTPSHDRSGYEEVRRLESFVREIKALHALRSHPNVAHLVGVAWEENECEEIFPILVIEYAQYLSLTHFMSSHRNRMPFSLKRKLCYEVARGLNSLHEVGMVWGDCKPENVLIFPDEIDETSFAAKITDFGCSISSFDQHTRLISRSIPWESPEHEEARGFEALVKTDVFSYGMLVWAIALDGRQFSQKLCSLDDESSQDIPTDHSVIEGWKRSGSLVSVASRSLSKYLRGTPNRVGLRSSSGEADLIKWILTNTMVPHVELRVPRLRSTMDRLNDNDWADCVISHVPIGNSHFRGELDVEKLVHLCGFNSPGLFSVKSTIFRRLVDFAHRQNSANAFFEASVCLVIGFGTSIDLQKALKFMRKAANLGLARAQGLFESMLSRTGTIEILDAPVTGEDDDLIIFDDFGLEENVESSPPRRDHNEDWLYDSTITGSWLASMELLQRDPQSWSDAEIELREKYEGVGSTFASRTIDDLMQASLPAKMGAQLAVGVNNRADKPLHRAAIEGDISKAERLLEMPNVNIDILNNDGETPLICAMRSGHADIAIMLMMRGADTALRDSRGVCISHWLISMRQPELHQLREFFSSVATNSASQKSVEYSNHYASTLEAGTALDWAVDRCHHDAVGFLLRRNADPMIQTGNRLPALYRAISDRNIQICAALLTAVSAEVVSGLDRHGRSAFDYALQPKYSFRRFLINRLDERQIVHHLVTALLESGADPLYVNSAGENALYCAVRWSDLACVDAILGHTSIQNDVPKCNPQQLCGSFAWNCLRRAVYAPQESYFDHLHQAVEDNIFVKEMFQWSPDGFTILHECAFVAEEMGLRIAKIIFKHSGFQTSKTTDRLLKMRCRQDGQRGRLTPFQLAVLLGKFKLADYLIALGTEPLRGIDGMRFLGYLLKYQLLSIEATVQLSTLNDLPVQGLDDELVRTLRVFPHPAGLLPCVLYLLKIEKNHKLHRLPDTENDPPLAYGPTYLDSTIDGRLRSGVSDPDNYGLSTRFHHARDFGSFLLCLREDHVENSRRGSHFLTALELGLEVTFRSPYPEQSKRVFEALLDHYQGPIHCNFPHLHYIYTGRTSYENLRRRETLLHLAIRAREPALVDRLLKAGADWEMANNEWQSPLFLSRLMVEGRDPRGFKHYGSFVSRLDVPGPAVLRRRNGHTKDEKILTLLEKHALKHKSRHWSFVRAFREVHWPWDEYEPDDLGLKSFLWWCLVTVALSVLVVLILSLVIGVAHMFKGFAQAVRGLKWAIRDFMTCYVASRENGTEPGQTCVIPILMAFDDTPIVRTVQNISTAMTAGFDKCYDPAANATVTPLWPVPGCPKEEVDLIWNSDDVKAAEFPSDEIREKHNQDYCDCRCSIFGKPRAG